MDTVKVVADAFFQDLNAFNGFIKITLVPELVQVSTNFVSSLDPQEVNFSRGSCTLNIVPNSQTGEGSYYKIQIVRRQTIGAGHRDTAIFSGVAVVPDHDCNLSDIITVEPVQPEPIEAAKIYASEAKAAAVQSQAYAEQSGASSTSAESARDAALAAQVGAETAQSGAEAAAVQSQTYAEQSGASSTSAETASTNAMTYAGNAESAKVSAESARDAAILARVASEEAQVLAVSAKDRAVEAETDALAAQASAESARDAALAAQVGAETARVGAETAQSGAETALAGVATAIATHNANTEAHADIRQEIANGGLWLKEEGSIVQMFPEPESELDVRVNFALTETPPASGEKSPDNPSTITGVESVQVVRCGTNILNLPNLSDTTIAGTTVSMQNQILHISGTKYGANVSNIFTNMHLFLPAGTYTLSITPSGDFPQPISLSILKDSNTSIASVNTYATSKTFTLTKETPIGLFRIGMYVNNVTYDCSIKINISVGSSPTPYTPCEGNTYTIPLGDTYYGGYVDSERGVLVKEWEEVVLDGTERWDNFNGVIPYTQMTLPSYGISAVDCILCTNYTSALIATYGVVTINPAAKNRLIVRPTAEQAFSGITDFKSWLAAQYAAGTPVKVAYKLVTPVEIPLSNLPKILSLPQSDRYTPKLNTVCSGQGSVDVGYSKSPIQEHNDLTAAIIELGAL
jgi:hypothetical protein